MADFDAGAPKIHTYIPPDTIKGTTAATLVLATAVAVGRTIVRYRRFKRLYVDDAFLAIAVAAAIAGAGVFYAALDGVFIEAETAAGLAPITPDFPNIFATTNTKIDVVVSLFWLSVFAVKFSFLSFFHRLIVHSRRLRIWWWVCVVISVPLTIANIIVPWLVCPSYKPIGIQECATPKNVKGSTITLEYGFTFDIVTDLLGEFALCLSPKHNPCNPVILALSFRLFPDSLTTRFSVATVISIPIILLHNSRSLYLRQKLILGFMLCLSIFLIIISIFRFISTQPGISGVWAYIWYLYWGDIQASVAIILVSATVFRSLFVSEHSGNKRAPRMNNQLKSWSPDGSPTTGQSPAGFSPKRWFSRFLSRSSRKSDMQQDQTNWRTNPLPGIQHAATMTGVRTMIWENGRATQGSFEGWKDDSISSIGKPSSHLNASGEMPGSMNEKERANYDSYV
ncbi:hypothetical protein MMC26_004027 [Xylographa opegraphella]|nr:hypothetical protein [Xylographa opegraphella]